MRYWFLVEEHGKYDATSRKLASVDVPDVDDAKELSAAEIFVVKIATILAKAPEDKPEHHVRLRLPDTF